MARKGFVLTLEAFTVLLLLLGMVFFFSYRPFDQKKVFYRMLLAEDFAEVSVKSRYFSSIKHFDAAPLREFYLKAGKSVGVNCVKFGFGSLKEVGCSNETQFFKASRSVLTDEGFREYELVLGFD